MLDTEQLKFCCVFCRMEKLNSSCWWYCFSVQLWMEHCSHLRPLIYRKSTCCALWHTSARENVGDIITRHITGCATGTDCRDSPHRSLACRCYYRW